MSFHSLTYQKIGRPIFTICMLLLIVGVITLSAPTEVYAVSDYGAAHFPYEPSVSDLSGYFVIEDAHGDDVMFSYQFMPVISVEVAGVTTPPYIQLYISGNSLRVSPVFDSSSIGDFALYLHEGDSISLVAYSSHIGQSSWVYNYDASYSITGLALVGSSVTLSNGDSYTYDSISLSFGSDDPYPELLYLYYQEIQSDLYESFYPIVTGWLESIGGNTSQMQSYLHQITILFTNYLTKSTLPTGELSILGYAESIDSSLKQLIDAVESLGSSGSSGVSDDLLQSIYSFLTTDSLNDNLAQVISGTMYQFYSQVGRGMIAQAVTNGITNSSIDDTLLDINDTLNDLVLILADLDAERYIWENSKTEYKYDEVDDHSVSAFGKLWSWLINPFMSLFASSSNGEISYDVESLDSGSVAIQQLSVGQYFQDVFFNPDAVNPLYPDLGDIDIGGLP